MWLLFQEGEPISTFLKDRCGIPAGLREKLAEMGVDALLQMVSKLLNYIYLLQLYLKIFWYISLATILITIYVNVFTAKIIHN